MSQPTQTVRDFISDSYQIVSANSPTVPLHGNDQNIGLKVLNRLLSEYSSSGQLLTVSQQIDYNLVQGVGDVIFADASFMPPPVVNVSPRLVNLENAWVTLSNVTYPLIDESRNEFFSAYKYQALLGLPRYVIVKPQTNLTVLTLFPAPSQLYVLSVYGKFALSSLTINDDMSVLPVYMQLYLQFALAKYLAVYKGRMSAWTPDLETEYQRLKTDMESNSSQNLDINVNQESWLNGAYRVRAGI